MTDKPKTFITKEWCINMARQEPDLEIGVGASSLSEFVARREINKFLDSELKLIKDLKHWNDKTIVQLIRKHCDHLKDLTDEELTDEELTICITYWKNK